MMFPQRNGVSGKPAPVVFDRGIVFPGRIDIFMAQYICHQIDIAGFPVETGAVCTAELMRRYFFQIRHQAAVFFYQIFHTAHLQPFLLQLQKQCVFMSFFGNRMFPFLHIGP